MAENQAFTEKEMSEQEARAVLALAKAKRERERAEGSKIIWVRNMRTGIESPCTVEAFKSLTKSPNFDDELYKLNDDESARAEQKVAESRYMAAREAYDAAEEKLKGLRASGGSTAQIMGARREMDKHRAVMDEFGARLGIEPRAEKPKRGRPKKEAEEPAEASAS